jgi:ribosomal protein L1
VNEDKFNLEMRKFLKKVGITSQREIEKAVRDALEQGRLKGDESIKVTATLTIPELDTVETIEGRIELAG